MAGIKRNLEFSDINRELQKIKHELDILAGFDKLPANIMVPTSLQAELEKLTGEQRDRAIFLQGQIAAYATIIDLMIV